MIDRNGTKILRISVGIVFFWFGFLKFFGATSPAEEIASRTISLITFDWMQPEVSMPFLAVIECLIGIGLLVRPVMKYAVWLLYFQMAGTLLPLLVFPGDTWEDIFVPTLLGQYIIKNAVLISAGVVLGTVAKGGELIADPEVAEKAKVEEELKA